MAKESAKKPSTPKKEAESNATEAGKKAPKEFWYVIRTTEIVEGGSKKYIGTSSLDNNAMLKALATTKPVVIENLIYVSIGGELKKYSETWEPHPNKVFLMPAHIVSLIPLEENWQQYKSSWEDSLLNKVETFFSSIK